MCRRDLTAELKWLLLRDLLSTKTEIFTYIMFLIYHYRLGQIRAAAEMQKYRVYHSDLVLCHSATEINVPGATATSVNPKMKLSIEWLDVNFSVLQNSVGSLL